MKRPYLKCSGDLVNHWRIDGILGAGFESDVYRVTDLRSGAIRSLKLMRGRNLIAMAEHTAAHYRRLRTFSRVKRFREWGVLPGQPGVGDRPFLIFDLIEGQTLPHFIQREPKHSARSASLADYLVLDLVKVVAGLNRHGFAVGDLDYGRNVIVERGTGRLVLCDLDCGVPDEPALDPGDDLDEVWNLCLRIYRRLGLSPPGWLYQAFHAAGSLTEVYRDLATGRRTGQVGKTPIRAPPP